MLRILRARLQPYMNWEIPDVQTEFINNRGTRDQIANIHWIIKKARGFQKNIYFCFIDYAKAFDCGSQQTGKFLKKREYQTTLSVSWKTCIQVKKQQLELDMEKQTGSKLEKKYIKAVYCHPAYLTYAEYIMQNAGLDESQAGIKIAGRNINNWMWIWGWYYSNGESKEELKSLLMRVKESEKVVL